MTEHIESAEALDALPVGTLGIDETYGTAWRQHDGWWVSLAGIVNQRRPRLPVTVLYRPDAPAPSAEDRDPRAFERTPEAAALGAAIEQAALDSGVGWDEVHPIELACRLLAAGYSLAARQPAPVSAETVTEWGVRYEADRDTVVHEPRASEHAARREAEASPTDTALVSREVTAWREVPRG